MAPEQEIEQIFRTLHPQLWRGLLAFTGNPDIASDAEAEAFTQAISRGSAIRNPEAWIWTSAFRIAAGMLAARPEAPHVDNVLHGFDQQQPLIELIEMLGDLSEQQRKVTILRYVGNYKLTEIADLLGTSAGTVRVQLHRAHESLRLLIGSAHDRL